MKTIETYRNDLTPEKQQEIFEALGGENGNYDVFPNKLAEFLTKIVDHYLSHDCGNLDLYLESKLIEKHGGNT